MSTTWLGAMMGRRSTCVRERVCIRFASMLLEPDISANGKDPLWNRPIGRFDRQGTLGVRLASIRTHWYFRDRCERQRLYRRRIGESSEIDWLSMCGCQR